MKLIKKQLKKLFNNRKTLIFIQIKKLDCSQLLQIKNKLLKTKIKLKIISNEILNQFFSNIKNKNFLNFFQGETIILYFKSVNWSFFCKIIYSNFKNIYYSFLYNENRLFLISNLFFKAKNRAFLSLLKNKIFDKFIFFLNKKNYFLVQVLYMSFLLKNKK